MPAPRPTVPTDAHHPQLQWYKRGTTAISLTEALNEAIHVEVLDNTVVDADAYYHLVTDTLIVVVNDTVQTVVARDGAPLRCPHDHCPTECEECCLPEA